jgi:hypothetical protein
MDWRAVTGAPPWREELSEGVEEPLRIAPKPAAIGGRDQLLIPFATSHNPVQPKGLIAIPPVLLRLALHRFTSRVLHLESQSGKRPLRSGESLGLLRWHPLG